MRIPNQMVVCLITELILDRLLVFPARWLAELNPFVSFYFAVTPEALSLLLVGVALFLGAVVYGIVKTRVVAPQKIDDHYIWLTGANAKYPDQFPEWGTAR